MAIADTFTVIADSIAHYVVAGKVWAHLVLAMPDHLHALLAVPAEEELASVVRNWKRFVAKEAGVKWPDGFFDHRLRSNESFEEKAHYIRMNPVRAGLATQPEAWPYVWPAYVDTTAR